MKNLKKSLSASTIKDFKTKLLSLEPTSRHPAINAIMSNYKYIKHYEISISFPTYQAQ